MGFMQRIGVDIDKYRSREYGRTQEIADAALFLGFSALVVPSARWECPNLVVFTEKIEPGQLTLVGSPNLVDWEVGANNFVVSPARAQKALAENTKRQYKSKSVAV